MSDRTDAVDTGLTRRELLRRAAVLSAAVGVADTALPDGTAAAADGTGSVTVDRGTNISVAVSPDRTRLAVDLGTVLWLLPAGGGPAVPVTDLIQDATLPHFAPDGRTLVFQSFRTGTYGIWTVGVDGTGLRQWTDGESDDQEPRFSPDGRTVVFASDRAGANNLWLLDLADGGVRRLTDSTALETMPNWSPDGQRVAFVVGNTAVDVVEVATGARTRVVTAPAGATLQGPSFAPDGRRIAYVRTTGTGSELVVDDTVVTTGEDVFGFAPVWWSDDELLYTADGLIRRRPLTGGTAAVVPFTAALAVSRPDHRRVRRDLDDRSARPVRGLSSPVASPDGRSVAFQALNALWVLPLGGRPRRVVADGYFAADPDWFPDGSALVYSSDRTGAAQLWRVDLGDGSTGQLTSDEGGHLRPRVSPDGSRVAYQDAAGATWVLDLTAGTTRQVVPPLFAPGRPTWSPDGAVLAMAAVRPYGRRNLAGRNQILTVDLASGRIRYADPVPGRSVSGRGDEGPVWTADGTAMVAVIDGQAWWLPVDQAGQRTGQARRLTDGSADGLSLSADGTLFHLSDGRLRRLPPGAAAPVDVPCPLTFRPAVDEPLVLRVGALWDGRSTALRRDVDLVVRDGRIAEVLDRRAATGVPVVDAGTCTAMPGLIDLHVHWHIRGRQWGDRQGRLLLSYGVTSVRGVADPAYDMLEAREAQQAGTRPAPRLFGTGDALDGDRVYYPSMRPVTSPEHLAREMRRADALDYDLVKTYIRFPWAYEREAVRAAHALGLPVTTHYLYPATGYGMDGLEHVGGGNRLGYTQIASRIGRVYDDVVALKAAAGTWITSTLIFAAVLHADDGSLLTDERTRVLMPATEYRLLQDLVATSAAEPRASLLRSLLAGAVDALLRIRRRGGLVVAGSDSPLDTVAIGLHQNLRAMVRHGFQPYEALLTATRDAAVALGRGDELGTVEAGRRADLSLVDGDPLADVRAAAAVRYVVVGGRLVSRAELMRPFLSPPAAGAPAPTRRLAALAEPEPGRHWWHGVPFVDPCGH